MSISALTALASLAACGVDVSASRPLTVATVKAQLLTASDVGSGYSSGTHSDTNAPITVPLPTNWTSISAACQDWYHSFTGANGGGGQSAHLFAEQAFNTSENNGYVVEWIGEPTSDPGGAVGKWAADGAACGSFSATIAETSTGSPTASPSSYTIAFTVHGVSAPSFGSDTGATEDTNTSPGTSTGYEETVTGVFGQEVVMVDVSTDGGSMSGVEQLMGRLLPKAAALVANPNPVTPSADVSGS